MWKFHQDCPSVDYLWLYFWWFLCLHLSYRWILNWSTNDTILLLFLLLFLPPAVNYTCIFTTYSMGLTFWSNSLGNKSLGTLELALACTWRRAAPSCMIEMQNQPWMLQILYINLSFVGLPLLKPWQPGQFEIQGLSWQNHVPLAAPAELFGWVVTMSDK